jgi:hypothetical protein
MEKRFEIELAEQQKPTRNIVWMAPATIGSMAMAWLNSTAGAQDISGLTSTASSSLGTVQTAVFTILGILLAVALGVLAYKLLKKPT